MKILNIMNTPGINTRITAPAKPMLNSHVTIKPKRRTRTWAYKITIDSHNLAVKQPI